MFFIPFEYQKKNQDKDSKKINLGKKNWLNSFYFLFCWSTSDLTLPIYYWNFLAFISSFKLYEKISNLTGNNNFNLGFLTITQENGKNDLYHFNTHFLSNFTKNLFTVSLKGNYFFFEFSAKGWRDVQNHFSIVRY
jgi:hypothetical protein